MSTHVCVHIMCHSKYDPTLIFEYDSYFVFDSNLCTHHMLTDYIFKANSNHRSKFGSLNDPYLGWDPNHIPTMRAKYISKTFILIIFIYFDFKYFKKRLTNFIINYNNTINN